MANLPKAKSSTVLGQMRDEVAGELKKTAGDTAKAVVSEPKKILESILGKPKSQDQSAEAQLEQGQSSNDPQQKMQAQQHIMKLRQEDQKRREALLRLHKQKLDEEKAYFDKTKQEEELEKKKEEQEEQQKKQEKVIQLRHEKEKEEAIQGAMVDKLVGTKEKGKMQGF